MHINFLGKVLIHGYIVMELKGLILRVLASISLVSASVLTKHWLKNFMTRTPDKEVLKDKPDIIIQLLEGACTVLWTQPSIQACNLYKPGISMQKTNKQKRIGM